MNGAVSGNVSAKILQTGSLLGPFLPSQSIKSKHSSSTHFDGASCAVYREESKEQATGSDVASNARRPCRCCPKSTCAWTPGENAEKASLNFEALAACAVCQLFLSESKGSLGLGKICNSFAVHPSLRLVERGHTVRWIQGPIFAAVPSCGCTEAWSQSLS